MQNGEKWSIRGFMPQLDAPDQIIASYNLLALILVILAPAKIPHQGWFLLFHLTVQVAILKQSQFPGFTEETTTGLKLSVIFRAWVPILIIIPFYSEATFLSHFFISGNLDGWLHRTDLALFGFNLNKNFSANQPLWLDEIFHGIYFSYYGLMIFPAILLYQKSIIRFRHYLAGLLLLLVIHNVLFVFLPAEGPIHLRADLFKPGTGWVFIPLMNWIYRWGDYAGAAIPSAHVAASLYIFLSLRKLIKPFGQMVFALWIGAIFLSTVYCAYHYGIDVLTGSLTGLIFYGIYRKWTWLKYRPPRVGGTKATMDILSAPSAPDTAN